MISFVCPILILFFINASHQTKNLHSKRIDRSKLNPKVVGLMLKANGKQYFVSSELCPGGVFLTKPVNENCLCFNGIFQIVRHCCSSNTRINTDNLEWRMNYKCGSFPDPEGDDERQKGRPIRAILPLSKPHNRFSSMVVLPSLTGNNTSKWRKFDLDDVIIRNNAQLSLNGRMEFEIVNLKPLGRVVKIWLGKSSETSVCYSGWLTELDHQNLRVKLETPGATLATDCCLNITNDNSPGEIGAECTSAVITVKVIDVQSADMNIGQCDQDVIGETDGDGESLHAIRKREQPKLQTTRFKRSPSNPTFSFTRDLDLPPIDYQDSGDQVDLISDRGPVLIKRENVNPENLAAPPIIKILNSGEGNGENINDYEETPMNFTSMPIMTTSTPPLPTIMILPRKKGISRASFKEQALATNEFIAILRNDLSVEIKEPETFRFQLLKRSFDIFLNVVPNEIVPQILVKTAFDVFYYLYEELDPILKRPPEIFERTMKYLNNCLSMEDLLNFTTCGCPPEIDALVIDPVSLQKLQTFYDGQGDQLQNIMKSMQHIQIRKDRRFIPERHDIYVEINWKVMDFVHSFCFQHFAEEFNSHHFYESELEKLFLFPEVQRRWFSGHKDLRYVRGIFPVSDLKMRMKQLDKVVAVGHSLSRYNGSYWLSRANVSPNEVQESSASIVTRQEKRLIFAQNMLDTASFLTADKERKFDPSNTVVGGMDSTERDAIYPFQFPEKLPAGELIWDGLAVCLHAEYSSRRSYFMDSGLWGVNPSLLELGKLYP